MTINHVKSHADKRKKKEQFTLPEALNSKVDDIITEKIQEAYQHPHPQHSNHSLHK